MSYADDLDDIFGEVTTPPKDVVKLENLQTPDEDLDNFFEDTPDSNVQKPADGGLVQELLKAYGIKDKIKIQDEEGNEEEVDFASLPIADQLQIIGPQNTASDVELDDEEIELLNVIRENNISPTDYVNAIRENAIAEYIKSNGGQTTQYQIDSYGDNELFFLDLKNRFDLTEDELQAELEKELTNPEAFKKKMDKLRSIYKASEDEQKTLAEAKELEDFTNVITTVASKNKEFHGIELENAEVAQTLDYILNFDESGVSKLAKDLNDPSKLYEIAWYLRYGKEAFAAIEKAYEAEIKKLKKAEPPKPADKKVVHKKPNKPISSIYDLN